jgi:Tol biopolymer transport system component
MRLHRHPRRLLRLLLRLTSLPTSLPIRLPTRSKLLGPTGARLVAIDEHGDRQLELLKPAAQLARDSDPAVSPDRRWVVFSSSRGRPLDETSLWIARLAPDATPVRLTHGPAIDTQPAWTRDGHAIVFASTRSHGNYDLFRLAIDAAGHPAGDPESLTSADTHEISPTVAADGSVIYAVLAAHADHTVDSHLERRASDGTIARVTEGPADSSPALSPDGSTLAFVRPIVRDGGQLDGTAPPFGGAAGRAQVPAVDGELWTMPVAGGEPVHVVDLPQTDEGGPVWSLDGRYLFATSLLRGDAGKPLFSSVIVIDLRAPRRVARILEDRVGPIARLTPAIVAPDLDAAALESSPEYVPELARIVAAAIASQPQEPP